MKKLLLLFCLLCFVQYNQAQTPHFSIAGFASMEGEGQFYHQGGTTGGEGGEIVTPTNFAELKKYVEDDSTPYVIRITKEFTTENPVYVDPSNGHATEETKTGAILSTYGEVLKIGSNKTLLGIGENAFLNRIGLNIQTQNNIIVRNIRISLMNVPISKSGENKIVALRNGVETLVGDPDCFSVQADVNSASKDISHHIWVDHCEFFNENISDKNRYDGLLDIKNNVKYVTISWCHFHHHSKACLSGKGNSDNFDRLITMHHNFFENIDGSRLPLQRFGHTHYFNNYIKGCEDGYNLRKDSHGYVEGCYFEDTKKPIFGKLSEGGGATLVDLIFKNCKNLPDGYENIDGAKFSVLKDSESFGVTDFVPSDYYSYSHILHTAEDTPAIVMQYAGVGKIDTDELEPTDIKSVSEENISITKVEGNIVINCYPGDLISVYQVDGKQVYFGRANSVTEIIEASSYKGIYIVELQSVMKSQQKKLLF